MPILPEHKEILLTQSGSKTLPEWCEYFQGLYEKKTISNFIYHNKLKPKKLDKATKSTIQSVNARKYHINQDYFKEWSHDMAYIFGLWCADGCIYSGKMFDITLHAKDKYILKRIAEKINYEGPINDYVDRQAARLNFSCVVIYNDILALGGSENKSNTLQFPHVPDEYLHDFIRGYFDGDGSIMLLKNNRVNSAFTSGSKSFLDELLTMLKERVGVIGGSYDASSKSLRFGKRDTIKIGEYMYKDDPDLFLLRKREKFNVISKGGKTP